MDMKPLGNTGIAVTPVGMGAMTIGHSRLALSLEAGASVVRYALERGINFIDTAESYNAGHYVKRALKALAPAFSSGILPRPVVVSKSSAHGHDGMRRAVDQCRAAMDLDQIDIFLLEGVRQAPDFAGRCGAWDCLQEAKAKGRVRAIGISTHDVDAAAEAVRVPGMDILFTLINYQGLGISKGGGPGDREDMEKAILEASAQGIGVFTMRALGGGSLARNYKEALDYASALPGSASVMIGMGSGKDVDDAVAYFEGRLPEAFVPDAQRKHVFIDRGSCAGCGDCVRYCTSKAIRLDEEGIAAVDYNVCVLCGFCAPVCPSHALILL